MALLDDALAASGGVDRWHQMTRFTAHISIDGLLIGRAGRLRDVVAEGSTSTQSLRFTGFIRPDQCASYTPDRVTIERLDGSELATRLHPGEHFPGEANHPAWDDLDLVYFCGFTLWSCITMPFVLLHPGVELEELPDWLERGQVSRRLRAVFPPDIVTHAREQLFYFDDVGLQRRMDYAGVVHHVWAHQPFSDITIPTLRRSLSCQPDGAVLSKPVLADIEIFDAFFE